MRLLLLFLLALSCAQSGDLPAFPGAEGFGAKSIGGRGGRVIKVTNLNAAGPGSLQAACEAPGPRIVVFAVSGVIKGDVSIKHPRITIAGQTAPGAGITIEGMLKNPYRIQPNLHDVTIRYLRVRPPRPTRVDASHDGIQLTDIDRLILDHISVSWAADENIDVCNSRELTIQWSAIEESETEGHEKGQHNFGLIMGYKGHSATVHHNLFAHHLRRAPLSGLEVLDHRNNVIYNMRRGIYWHPPRMNESRPGKGFRANIVANYFLPGPNVRAIESAIDAKAAEEIYAAGNHFEGAGGVVDPWQHPLNRSIFLEYPIRAREPWPAPAVATQSAAQAFEKVLQLAGCLPRDAVSRRTVEEIRGRSGAWGRHDPPGGLMAGLNPAAAPPDKDDDGLPDAWERAHKLNPEDPADSSRIGPGGYVWIEVYVNELADRLAGRP
jgi:hypothetical protein